MSVRTHASPAGGGAEAFDRIILKGQEYGGGWTGSTANRAYASYLEVHHEATIQAIGIYVDDPCSGNIQLGLYDAAFVLQCVTAIIPVAGLVGGAWNWFATTTNPTIAAGLYWIAWTCDTTYNPGVAGLQVAIGWLWEQDSVDSADLGFWKRVRQDGAYPLPSPLVPVNSANEIHGLALRV